MKRSYPSVSEAMTDARRRDRRVDPVLRAEVAALRAELAADRARLRADMTAAMFGRRTAPNRGVAHAPERRIADADKRTPSTPPRPGRRATFPMMPSASGARWFP